MQADIIDRYFPELQAGVRERLNGLGPLYSEWNNQINVVSRKDIEHLFERHILHSLAIYRFLPFVRSSRILDIGTGGGFPGIPLAVVMPEVEFVLTDSIGKKIRVVQEISAALGLKNVTALHTRAESVKGPFDFAVSRAVAPLSDLIFWSRKTISRTHRNALPNGLICLKGGELRQEIKSCGRLVEEHRISAYFTEAYFEEKKILYVPM